MGRSFLKFVAWVAVILGVIGGILYAVWFDAWTVPSDDARLGPALAPNMHEGDFVVVTRGTGAKLGWLVRCPDPDAPGRFVLGRTIALGGQSIAIERDAVTVDGRKLGAPSSCAQGVVDVMNPASGEELKLYCHVEELGSQNYEVLYLAKNNEGKHESVVDPGKAFLVSDNRHVHLDSRDFGQVDPNACQHVVFRLWSAKGWGDSAGRLTLLY
jgi:signal peptidase I